MSVKKRSVLSANPQLRPHDLHKKYRKLAIPAVVAAVAAEKRRMSGQPKRPAPRDKDQDS